MDFGSPRLSDSPFIAGLNARERSPLRVAVTLVAGLVGGVFIGLVCGLFAVFALAAAFGAFSGQPSEMAQKIGSLLGGGADLRSALTLLVLATATNAPLAATFVGLAALIAGRPARSYLTASPRLRWRLLALGLALSFLAIGPFVIVGQLQDPHAGPLPILSLARSAAGRAGYALACILLLIPAAAAEEVVFRGWLLRQSAVLTRNPAVLMAVNGVLFSAVHLEFSPDAFLTRALMGAGFVYMTLRLAGTEFSIGAHAANNILIVLFIQPLTLKPTPSTGVTGESLLEDVGLFLSYVALAELTARWGPLRRWSGAEVVAAEAAESFS
jgi:membrane protease YdiL (CAAX protease family)